MGKIMYLGDEYSSDGTTVIPNPEGEATDDLNTVQIGEDIFNVVGSGGGGGSVVALPSLYSTKEKMVGLWTDGKPLYQKTKVFSNVSKNGSLSFGVENAENVFVCDIGKGSNGIPLPYVHGSAPSNNIGGFLNVSANDVTWEFRSGNDAQSSLSGFMTIRYTKTTDTPVEDFNLQDFGIFTPVIYSLEEREIGVWTDGKPLYEKNIVFTATQNTGAGSQSYPHNIPNIDKIWVSEVHGNIDTPRPQNNSYAISVTVTATDIYVETGVDRRTVVVDVTLRYTKTTDTPGSGSYAELGTPAVHIDGTERVIGTWFGETLYQKTLYDAGGKNGSFNINHGIENLKAVVNYSGCVTDVTYPIPLPRIAYDGNNVGIQSSGPTQIGLCNPTAFGTRLVNWYITIQYTKTTT